MKRRGERIHSMIGTENGELLIAYHNKPPEWKRIEVTEAITDIILEREIKEADTYFKKIREVKKMRDILTLWGDDE